MNNIANSKAVVTMSSREIAALTGKLHKNVMADCRNMFDALKLQSADFSADYQDAKGRTYQEFWLDQDLTLTLMTGYSIPLRHKVTKRWRELESQISRRALPGDYKEALLALVQAETEKEQIAFQRDQAIETKAWIGERREATAMATASAEKRKANKLAEKLGECKAHATIKAVERVTGIKHSPYPMRKWCKENNSAPRDVPDETYGTVKSWPAGAWKEVHGVDIAKLF